MKSMTKQHSDEMMKLVKKVVCESSESDQYDDSSDFQSDWDTVTTILNSEKMNHWFQVTDDNYGTDILRKLYKVQKYLKKLDKELNTAG